MDSFRFIIIAHVFVDDYILIACQLKEKIDNLVINTENDIEVSKNTYLEVIEFVTTGFEEEDMLGDNSAGTCPSSASEAGTASNTIHEDITAVHNKIKLYLP